MEIPLNPSNVDILPAAPLPGQRIVLRAFPSTVQIIHVISNYREAVMGEIPVPYSPQSRQWWKERIFSETEEYLRKYGAR